jgi:hypothetical protein
MKTVRLLAFVSCLALPARAQQALHTDQSGNPTTPLNLASPNATGVAKLPPAAYIGANWVYASFNDAASPGETLSLSYSQDGINWTTTAPNYTAPTGNGVRDSSIIRLNGVYYVAYTAGNFGSANYFQICQSTDLVNWTYLCNVDTTVSGSGGYTWAPEWFVDRDGTVYLYFCRPNTGGVWTVFYVKATSLALTSWTAAAGVTLPGRQAIDPQVVRDGDTYYLSYRNDNQTDCVEIASGTSPISFTPWKTGDFAGWGSPHEGPSLVHMGGLRWRMYFDYITGTLSGSVVAYSDSFDGMNTWTAAAPAVGIPSHGTCLALNDVGGSKNLPSPAAPPPVVFEAQGNVSTLATSFTTYPLGTVVTNLGGGAWDGTNYIYTTPVSGTYEIVAHIRLADSVGASVNDVGIGVDTANGDSPNVVWQGAVQSATRQTMQFTRIAHFAAGSALRMFTYIDGTSSGEADLVITLLAPD